MRSFMLLATLCFTLVTVSMARPGAIHLGARQDYSSQANTIRSICQRIHALTVFANMTTNQTAFNKLVTKGHLSQEQIDFIKKEPAYLIVELESLTSNTTLTSECEVIDAHHNIIKQCKKFRKLERLAQLASNHTALDEHLAGETLNKKQVEQLHKNMESAVIDLQEMRGNSTLMGLCTNEVELQQNAVLQQDGAIGIQVVDNSGAIAMSTNGSGALFQVRLTPGVLISISLGILFAW